MLRYFLLATLSPILLVLAVNLAVDPFCFFGASNKIISRKYLFDERIQKTNYVTHADGKYDALLLGSSRTAGMNSADFESDKFFNYAVSGLLPWEYEGFVKIFRKHNDVKTVVIGVDFFSTNADQGVPDAEPATYYENDASYHSLLRYTGLHYSRVSISCSLRTFCNERSYTPQFARTWNPVSLIERTTKLNVQLKQYETGYYSSNYTFDAALETKFSKLRDANPGIKLIAFTTPESAELFSLMIHQGLYPDYVRWLEALYKSFDEVYVFSGINSITLDPENYIDAHHFSPKVGRYIAMRIEGRSEGVPSDFGKMLTKAELEFVKRHPAMPVNR